MAQKRKAGELPKAVADLKEAIEATGAEITAESLASKDFAALRNKAKTGLKGSLPKNVNEITYTFKPNEGRQFLADYMLDPEQCLKKLIENKETKFVTEGSSGVKEMFNIVQMSSPRYLNSLKNAKALAETLPSQKHEVPSIAANGHRQYNFARVLDFWKKGNTSEASVTAEGALSSTDYSGMAQHFKNAEPAQKKQKAAARTATKKRNKSGGQCVQDDKIPEKKEYGKAKEQLERSRRATQAFVEKARKERYPAYHANPVSQINRSPIKVHSVLQGAYSA